VYCHREDDRRTGGKLETFYYASAMLTYTHCRSPDSVTAAAIALAVNQGAAQP